jgi:hypothetical protein
MKTKNRIFAKNFMGDILYTVAVILIIGWLIGFIGFHVGGLIHVLLVVAVIVILVRLIQGRRIL